MQLEPDGTFGRRFSSTTRRGFQVQLLIFQSVANMSGEFYNSLLAMREDPEIGVVVSGF